MIRHGKALLGADFDTKTAGTAFEMVDLPVLGTVFLGSLDDGDGVNRAALAAQSAGNAGFDVVVHLAPCNFGKFPRPFRVHQGCRALDQVAGHRS